MDGSGTSPASRRGAHMAKYKACKDSFEFAADLEQAARVLGIDSARDTAVTLAIQLHGKITANTPVDTGRARANWYLSDGSPRIETTQATIPQVYSPGDITGDSIIYITNSLPYIVPLEYGHSKQAPMGMVRIAIAEIMASISPPAQTP
jgi:hypothetical protein